jgi:hypothetical protein
MICGSKVLWLSTILVDLLIACLIWSVVVCMRVKQVLIYVDIYINIHVFWRERSNVVIISSPIVRLPVPTKSIVLLKRNLIQPWWWTRDCFLRKHSFNSLHRWLCRTSILRKRGLYLAILFYSFCSLWVWNNSYRIVTSFALLFQKRSILKFLNNRFFDDIGFKFFFIHF